MTSSRTAFGIPRTVGLPVLWLLGFLLAVPAAASGAETPPGATTEAATLDTTMEAGEADAQVPKRRMVSWNHYDGPITSLRVGYGFLIDASAYSQDETSKEQVTLEDTDYGLRDFRLLFKGTFKTKRPFSWTIGYMYDGADKSWRFRQTGLMIGAPELLGSFFIGRTKEGYSLIKVMVGYDGWTNERNQFEDAFIPILADGVKWLGYAPKQRLLWNLGYYGDALSENEKFSTYDHQVAARLVWLPILSDSNKQLLHIGVMGRDAHPDNSKFQARSRPGDYLTPYFVDTGKFSTSQARTLGYEVFYRKGPWMIGSEYNWQSFDAADAGDPQFHGGDAVITWIVTGETRAYNTSGGYFKAVSPARSVFEGGPGAWETVLHYSYIDLDDANLKGGRFWRLTPVVNWHLSDNLRLEFVYGYGHLDRFDLQGDTQFFQFRFQTIL